MSNIQNLPRAAAAALLLLVVTFPAWASMQSPAFVGPGNPRFDFNESLAEVRASADGRFVVFVSGVSLPAVNLPGGFAETINYNVYMRDMQTGQLTLVSINSAGNAPGNGGAGNAVISDDGRYVFFTSTSTDLVLGSTTVGGIFVYDSQTGRNSLIAPNGARHFISANGRTVVFHRFINNAFDKDLYAYDMETGVTELVTPSHTGGASDGRSQLPQYENFYAQTNIDRSRKIISDDGRFVVFASLAANLVSLPDTNGGFDVFVRDLQTDTTRLVTVNRAGTDTSRYIEGERFDTFGAAISADGRLVAFTSRAPDLVEGTPSGSYELFVRDMEAGTIEVASARMAGAAWNAAGSGSPSFSRDGRYLAFQSYATEIVPNDNSREGSNSDVFVRDLQTDTTTLVSVNSAGTGSGNRGSESPQISANGRFVAFVSGASNLDAGAASTGGDVFVRDLQAGVTRLLSVDSSGAAGAGSSFAPSITADGEMVFFESFSEKLVTQGERFTARYAYAGYISEFFAALTAPSRLRFEAARYDVAEDGGSVTVTVTRNGATTDAVTADYTTQDGLARAGRDYTATSGTIAFAPGETTKTITIPILDNNADQGDDAFFVYLNDFNYVPLPTVLNTTMVVIADNDEMPTLSLADTNFVEGNSGFKPLAITATLSAPSARPVSFTARIVNGGTASNGDDYVSRLSYISGTFEPGETTKSFTNNGYDVLGDDKFESDETIVLNVTDVTNAILGDGEGVVTILNDDLPPTLFIDDTSVIEGNPPEGSARVIPFIRLSNPSGLPVTVRLTTTDGTAAAIQDYTHRSVTVTIPPGSTYPYPYGGEENYVPITNDEVVEPTETFFLILSDATNATISDPEAMVTIFDGDAPAVEFAAASQSASESSSTATVKVRRRGAYNRLPASVDYMISDGTATAGADYTAQTGTLVFGATEFEKTITFIIAEDSVVEGTETVILSLRNPGGSTLLGDRTTTELRILDNDGCTTSLNPPALPQFPAAGDPIEIVDVENGSGPGCGFRTASDSDFITVVFSVPMSIQFKVAPNPNAASRTGTLTRGGQTLTIRQSGTASGSAFEVGSPTYPTIEGAGNVAVRVLRQGDTNGPASVRFNTIDPAAAASCDPTATQPDGTPSPRGIARAGCDYAATSRILTWPANDSEPKVIMIPIIDDSHDEGTETFRVALSEPQGGEVGGVGTATITISDNYRACNYSINSSSRTSPAAGETTTVNVTGLGGCNWTAVSNSNFISVTSGASGAGNGSVTLNISANNSGVPRSGTVTIAGQTFTVTQPELTPEASTLQFGAASYSVGEAEGLATVTVTRTGGSAGAVSVDYRTMDTDTFTVSCADSANNNGGAFARCDFATTVGRLNFAPGEVQKTITVPVINDGHAEGAETFQLVLSNPVGVVTLGTASATTVTIQDNDEAGAPNPVTASHQFFVRQQYLDFLSREPDANGFNAWLGVLSQCADPNTGPNVPSQCDRIYVSGEGFFRSQEFQLKGFYVFRFYRLAFNRLPEYSEIVSDMSFVAGQTAEEVYARKAQLPTLITQRQEFKTAYDGMTNAQYVSTLMGRYNPQQVTTPDPANPDGSVKVTLTTDDLINRLDANTLTRAQVLRAVADSDAVGVQEFNNAFVGMQYYGYLRRKPDQAGFNAWLSVLQSGDVRTMVNGFLNSTEYKLRFGQP